MIICLLEWLPWDVCVYLYNFFLFNPFGLKVFYKKLHTILELMCMNFILEIFVTIKKFPFEAENHPCFFWQILKILIELFTNSALIQQVAQFPFPCFISPRVCCHLSSKANSTSLCISICNANKIEQESRWILIMWVMKLERYRHKGAWSSNSIPSDRNIQDIH